MTFAEIGLLVGLVVAGALIAYGCYMIAPPAGFIAAGVLLAAIVVMMTVEVGE